MFARRSETLGVDCGSSPLASDGRSPTLFLAAPIGEHCMDLLRTAVVDITTLVATCHALKSLPSEGETVLQRKPRNRLRRDLKRGAVAYIDALARTRRGALDDALLCRCRVAAEKQMPHALAQQDLLVRIMVSEAGSLDGLAAARQDLWRLAHMAIYLSSGMATFPPNTFQCTVPMPRLAMPAPSRLPINAWLELLGMP